MLKPVCLWVPTKVPGPGRLHLECWDWDRVGKDDFIGQTSIDLEDRFFSNTWRGLGASEHVQPARGIPLGCWDPSTTCRSPGLQSFYISVEQISRVKFENPSGKGSSHNVCCGSKIWWGGGVQRRGKWGGDCDRRVLIQCFIKQPLRRLRSSKHAPFLRKTFNMWIGSSRGPKVGASSM